MIRLRQHGGARGRYATVKVQRSRCGQGLLQTHTFPDASAATGLASGIPAGRTLMKLPWYYQGTVYAGRGRGAGSRDSGMRLNGGLVDAFLPIRETLREPLRPRTETCP